MINSIKMRKNPLNIKGNLGKVYIVKNHPEIFTDGIILLEDRNPEEVSQWLEKVMYQLNLSITMDYSTVEETKRMYLKKEYYPVSISKIDAKENTVTLIANNGTSIIVNAEYYKWLTMKGYIIKSTGEQNKPLILERKGKYAGLFMPRTK